MIITIYINIYFLYIPLIYSISLAIISSNIILYYFYPFYKLTEEKESLSLWIYLLFIFFSLLYLLIFILYVCLSNTKFDNKIKNDIINNES